MGQSNKGSIPTFEAGKANNNFRELKLFLTPYIHSCCRFRQHTIKFPILSLTDGLPNTYYIQIEYYLYSYNNNYTE